jgi:hypothetical protein
VFGVGGRLCHPARLNLKARVGLQRCGGDGFWLLKSSRKGQVLALAVVSFKIIEETGIQEY